MFASPVARAAHVRVPLINFLGKRVIPSEYLLCLSISSEGATASIGPLDEVWRNRAASQRPQHPGSVAKLAKPAKIDNVHEAREARQVQRSQLKLMLTHPQRTSTTPPKFTRKPPSPSFPRTSSTTSPRPRRLPFTAPLSSPRPASTLTATSFLSVSGE
jgi:hypothetical protein